MGKTVILSVSDGVTNRWGEQFVKRQPLSRQQMLVPSSPTVTEAKNRLIDAIKATGVGGTLIIAVGHGGSSGVSSLEGMVDIAPSKMMRLGGLNATVPPNFVSVFYDVNFGGTPQVSDLDHDLKNNPSSKRLANWKVYQEIATAFKTVAPREVVLLSCNVGNAVDFVRKIANDWRLIVRAYNVQVAFDPNPPRAKMYLVNSPPPYPTAAETILHEEELPFAPTNTIQVGPPL